MAGEVDIQVDAARDQLRNARAVKAILKRYDPKLCEALERAGQTGFLPTGQCREFVHGSGAYTRTQ